MSLFNSGFIKHLQWKILWIHCFTCEYMKTVLLVLAAIDRSIMYSEPQRTSSGAVCLNISLWHFLIDGEGEKEGGWSSPHFGGLKTHKVSKHWWRRQQVLFNDLMTVQKQATHWGSNWKPAGLLHTRREDKLTMTPRGSSSTRGYYRWQPSALKSEANGEVL